MYKVSPMPPSAARVRLQPRGLDPGDGADFVLVGGVAGNADRADDIAAGVPDEHAARNRHQTALAHHRERPEELRVLGGTAGQRTAGKAHAERAPGFAEGDVEAQN